VKVEARLEAQRVLGEDKMTKVLEKNVDKVIGVEDEANTAPLLGKVSIGGSPVYKIEYEYWYHHCNQLVLPFFVRGDEISCSRCHCSFVEQIQRQTQGIASPFFYPPLVGNVVGHEQGDRPTTILVHGLPTFSFFVATNFFPTQCGRDSGVLDWTEVSRYKE
jgi:hypothetical protein